MKVYLELTQEDLENLGYENEEDVSIPELKYSIKTAIENSRRYEEISEDVYKRFLRKRK